jgi:hypothetical protein
MIVRYHATMPVDGVMLCASGGQGDAIWEFRGKITDYH